MSGRLETTFQRLRDKKEKALIAYLMAGDPGLAETEQLVVALEQAGADIIELGVPFSDPIADGPVIQQAAERGLKSGTTLRKILASVTSLRKQTNIPIVLMLYYNSIHAMIKKALPIPALDKEFMVGEIQFYEARAHGADAVLLIVAALERRQLIDFYALATELGMDSLFETHHERELDRVLEWIPTARLIGINNRDLKTFTTDLNVTFRLAKRIPDDKVIVSESGIRSRADVVKLAEAGIHAMLVGESLIKSDDIGKKVEELRGASA
ncbi:MAG: tryptophan synthase subunit alpha [Nitrospira sp.]|nr:tryptophan synthase subunit alpha [Nitrospira sp.]